MSHRLSLPDESQHPASGGDDRARVISSRPGVEHEDILRDVLQARNWQIRGEWPGIPSRRHHNADSGASRLAQRFDLSKSLVPGGVAQFAEIRVEYRQNDLRFRVAQ